MAINRNPHLKIGVVRMARKISVIYVASHRLMQNRFEGIVSDR
jgi:hypothetical protein